MAKAGPTNFAVMVLMARKRARSRANLNLHRIDDQFNKAPEGYRMSPTRYAPVSSSKPGQARPDKLPFEGFEGECAE